MSWDSGGGGGELTKKKKYELESAKDTSKVYGSDFDDMARRRPDLSRIKKLIGYQPKFSLVKGLKKIIDYYGK